MCIRDSSGPLVFLAFAKNISRGNVDDAGLDTESQQTVSFEVKVIESVMFGPSLEEYDCELQEDQANNLSGCVSYVGSSDMFVDGGKMQLSPNGSLSFELKSWLHGTALIGVVLHDDGGTELSGSNCSMMHNFSLHAANSYVCLLYTSPSPRDVEESRMPSSA